MLSLSKPIVVDGVSVFRDHADPSQFWYLPPVVGIARRVDGVPEFTFLMYKPAVAGAGIKGGGFASFTSTLRLPDALQSRIMSRVNAEPGVEQPVRLAVPTFDQGSVQVVALNLQGGGGTAAKPAAAGSFNAVELIQGATVPSMDAANRAVFSLTLSQEGAIILKEAFTDGMAPIGVIYNLSYLAMRPALDVEITADFERIYTYFGGSLEGSYMFFKASIEAAFESLVSEGAITIKVVNFTGEEDEKEQEKWALSFFKDDLLSKWFEPTLAPGKLLNTLDDEPTKDEPKKDEPKKDEPKKDEPKKDEPKKDEPKKEDPKKEEPVLQKASLVKDSEEPDPLPADRSVTHTPAATGTTETVKVTGAGATVKVGGQPVALDPQGQFTVVVEPATNKPIEVSWPQGAPGASEPAQEKLFGLFFNFDKPTEANWKVNPPSTEFRSYVENTTTDPRFRDATGLLKLEGDGEWPGTEKGADRLKAWIQTLPTPRTVKLEAFASHEDVTAVPEPQRTAYNLRLSQRRLDVAAAIVARAGATVSGQQARGDSVAAARPGAHSPMGGDPDNRVVHVIATVPGKAGGPGAAGGSWTGKLVRPASVTPPNGGGGTPPSGGTPPAGGTPPSGTKPEVPKIELPKVPDTKPASAALKLKFVRQEERKKLTLKYNRSEAIRLTVAPQGLLGLLLADLGGNMDQLFKEIDLDSPFFREFKVEASAPFDFAAIGLTSATLAIDYGDPAVPSDHKHGELTFTPDDHGDKAFTVFLNSTHDVDYDARFSYFFSPQSGWDADAFEYQVVENSTEERTRVLNPFEHIDFRQLRFEPGDIDWEIVSSIDILLTASGYANPEPTTQLKLTKDSGPQTWRLRGSKPIPPDRTVSYVLRQTLIGGTSEETAPVTVTEPIVAVNDLLEGALNLVFVPGFDPAAVMMVFVDIEYHDEAHQYHRVFRQEVAGSATAANPVRVRVALRDPNARAYRFRLTFVGPNGQFDQRAWQDSTEEIISLR